MKKKNLKLIKKSDGKLILLNSLKTYQVKKAHFVVLNFPNLYLKFIFFYITQVLIVRYKMVVKFHST